MSTPFLSGDANTAQLADTLNNTMREVKSLQDVQIFKDDTGMRRVLAGRGPDGFYGFKVSKDGFDVYTATNENLLFSSSNQSVFNVVDDGTLTSADLTIAAPGAGNFDQDTATTSAAHGLSYVPAILAFVQNTSEYVPVPYTFYTGTGTTGQWVTVSARVDATNVYLVVDSVIAGGSGISYPAGTFSLKYYLLQETAN